MDVSVDVHSPNGPSMRFHPHLTEPEERLVYTDAEAGELLGISRVFAYELVARGELPVICLGWRIVVPRPRS